MDKLIIQGGMGIGVSNPHLAKTCSRFGILGTVSCTGAERVLSNMLQLGDIDEMCRHALSHFPFPDMAERVLKRHFIPGGKSPEQVFNEVPMFTFRSRRDLVELAVVGSFVLVWLAKEGHDGPISVNYLEKLQIGHIYHLAGAMLAGVDYVTMGAGITLQIPGVLDALAFGGVPTYRVDVTGSTSGTKQISFDPCEFFGEKFPKELKRPGFLPIVSTDALANIMVTKLPEGSIQGFVIETPDAGGHNAPPRKKGEFDARGQPVYGPRDEVNFDKLGSFGIPFWIGGAYASPEGLAKARKLGAVGIQAGSIFALSDDSGLDSYYRAEIRRLGYRGELEVLSDPTASPTGFPFQIPQLQGTHSDSEVYATRERNCSRKALQFPAELPNGKIVFRCSAEPVEDYVRRGGKKEDTIGARCLCNGLFSAVGLGDPNERPIFTLGKDVSFLSRLMTSEGDNYSAWQAIQYLLSR
ncbi:MAG: nitronate monooxygenase [Candidatus Paceibacterota bacterium]